MIFTLRFHLFFQTAYAQTSANTASDSIAYKITVELKPATFKKLFLEAYFGNIVLLIDSSSVNPNTNQATFTGTKKLQQQIEAGTSEADIRKSWEKGLKDFKEMRKKYLIYK